MDEADQEFYPKVYSVVQQAKLNHSPYLSAGSVSATLLPTQLPIHVPGKAVYDEPST